MIILLLFLLFTNIVKADISVQLHNVLYTANGTLLCEKIIETYQTTGNVSFCATETNLPRYIYGLTLNSLHLKGIHMTELISAFPSSLNTSLHSEDFFPGGVGEVTLVTNRVILLQLVIGVLFANFITSFGIALISYFSIRYKFHSINNEPPIEKEQEDALEKQQQQEDDDDDDDY